MKSLICIWIALCFIGCGNSEKKEVLELVKEWNGKEILFPTESYTTVLGKDTFMMEENPEYKVVVYTDSVGCTSCKLQLHRWMELMSIIKIVFGIPRTSLMGSVAQKYGDLVEAARLFYQKQPGNLILYFLPLNILPQISLHLHRMECFITRKIPHIPESQTGSYLRNWGFRETRADGLCFTLRGTVG